MFNDFSEKMMKPYRWMMIRMAIGLLLTLPLLTYGENLPSAEEPCQTDALEQDTHVAREQCQQAAGEAKLSEHLQPESEADEQPESEAVAQHESETVAQPEAEAVAHTLRKAAEEGHADAQSSLGFMYSVGLGVEQDEVEAAKWFRLAAEQGHAEAQYRLGSIYDNSEAFAEENPEAMKWYKMAAEQGYALAQSRLGDRYSIDLDYKEAAKWYGLAAKQGNMHAKRILGLLQPRLAEIDARANLEGIQPRLKEFDTRAGFGDRYPNPMRNVDRKRAERPKKDNSISWVLAGMPVMIMLFALFHACNILDKLVSNNLGRDAFKRYRQVEEGEDASARPGPGEMVGAGRGVEQDDTETVEQYEFAAEEGFTAAQDGLKEAVVADRGVEPDDEEAVERYELVVEEEYVPALGRLEEIVAADWDVEQDDVEAVDHPELTAEQEDGDTPKEQIPLPASQPSFFSSVFEDESVLSRDTDILFQHANRRYRKNPQKKGSDGFREAERLLRIAAAWGHEGAVGLLEKMSMTEPAAPDDGTTADDIIGIGKIALLPSEERIGEMALAKNLHPETGLPVVIDLPNSRLLDPETGEPLKANFQTSRLLNRMR